MKPQYLLLEDVEGLGRSGDLVSAKPGFVNNYLLPKQKALRADKRTLRMQSRLQEERAKQAKIDLELSRKIAEATADLILEIEVKVDPEGKMYGSVGPQEISDLLNAKSIEVEKRFVKLHHPLKDTGVHTVPLKLKEGVEAFVKLKIRAEGISDEELAKIQAKAARTEEKAAKADSEKAQEEIQSEES